MSEPPYNPPPSPYTIAVKPGAPYQESSKGEWVVDWHWRVLWRKDGSIAKSGTAQKGTREAAIEEAQGWIQFSNYSDDCWQGIDPATGGPVVQPPAPAPRSPELRGGYMLKDYPFLPGASAR